MPAVERSRVRDHGQIPRPPNSWILYRSDMVALLPPPPPGTTRSQAEVSRIISQMWKKESPEVKAEYERRAEVKKLEHAALYPHYRYMPKSKELKEELKKNKELTKRNKRKQKEEGRQAPEISRPFESGAPPQEFPPFTSFPFPFLSADPANYSQSGPSPPMSAADSPSPEPFRHAQSIDATNERANTHAVTNQNVNSHYRPHTTAPQTQPQYPMVEQPDYHPATTSHYRTNSNEPQQEENCYQQQQYQQPQDLQANQAGLVHQQQYAFIQNALQPSDASSSQEFLSFDLQQFAGQNLGAWTFQNSEFQPALDHFLNTSGDCYQMQINPVDQLPLGDEPVGPLEVELGQIGLDFSHLPWEGTPALNMGTYQSFFDNTPGQNSGVDDMVGPSSQASPVEGSGLPSADADQGFHFDQFINFDPTFDYLPPTPINEQTSDIVERTSYVPPAGAMHSSKRRVAASWNPSFAMTDPIDV